MKAINFLTYCTESKFIITKTQEFLNKFIPAMVFYSQPFSPDLIEKYFEDDIDVDYKLALQMTDSVPNFDNLDEFITWFQKNYSCAVFNATAIKELGL